MSPLVFITGASSGIGQALAWRFHQAGYRLALVARRTSEMKSWAGAQGISVDSYQIYSSDVSDIGSITAAGQECIRRQGVPDVVIANAGISALEQFFRTLDIPATLREVGIGEEKLDVMAEKAGAKLSEAYVSLNKDDVLAIFKACLG